MQNSLDHTTERYHLLDAELAATRAVNEGRIYPFHKKPFIAGFLEGRKMSTNQQDFNQTIGELDRLLSAFLLLLNEETDEVNRKTLKHHADDLIGVGTTMLEKLGKLQVEPHKTSFDIVREGLNGKVNQQIIIDFVQKAIAEKKL